MRVIALEDSDRVKSFFSRPGADQFEVFPAANGRRGEGREEFNEALALFHYGYVPSDVEIAIAASHLRVLRDFAEEAGSGGDVMVVAEDDALLAPAFQPVVESIAASTGGADFVLLADPFAEAGISHVTGRSENTVSLSALARTVSTVDGIRYRCGHYSGKLWGAGLYLATRRAARLYVDGVDAIGGVGWVADDWRMFQRYAGADVKFVRPNLADWLGDSTFRTAAPKVTRFAPQTLRERVAGTIAVRSRARSIRRAAAATLHDVEVGIERWVDQR